MRLTSAALVLLAGAAAATGQGDDPGFAPTLPAAIGEVSGWEVVAGDFESTDMRGAYRFYVNPSRQAMYQLMRYRVELTGAAGAEHRRGSAERVAFVRRPGAREPMLLWVRSGQGVAVAWRALATDTDEYKVELAVLMGVLAVHRAAPAPEAP